MKRTVVKYYLPDHGMTKDDPFETITEWRADAYPFYVVEDCAKDYHSNHDGWDSPWPLNITLILEDGTEKTYSVDLEFSPEFFAHEIKSDNNA